MLNINSITKGIVIDHIKVGCGYKIFKLLELDKAEFTVALIMNVNSKKYEKKDMIKIENTIDMNFSVLALVDKGLTINIIENEKIKEKINLTLPSKVTDYIRCKNPRCITTVEREVKNKFLLVDKEHGIYKCAYCDNLHYTGGRREENL